MTGGRAKPPAGGGATAVTPDDDPYALEIVTTLTKSLPAPHSKNTSIGMDTRVRVRDNEAWVRSDLSASRREPDGVVAIGADRGIECIAFRRGETHHPSRGGCVVRS